jgi:HSP20 family molecular chaperone IbpA
VVGKEHGITRASLGSLEKDQMVVKAELPGMTKDDIQISVSDNVLTIK